MFAWPAFAITAIGLEPAAASFVIAVCRRSGNGRSSPFTPAAASACLRASRNVSARYGVPRFGWQNTRSSSPLNEERRRCRQSSSASVDGIAIDRTPSSDLESRTAEHVLDQVDVAPAERDQLG